MAELKAKLTLDTSHYASSISRIKEHNKDLGVGLEKLTTKLVEAFSVSRILEQTKALSEHAREIVNGSSKMDVSTQRFQDLELAASKTGASMESVSKAYSKIAVNAQAALGGDKGMAAAFESLGISAKDLKSLKVDQIFEKMAHSLERMSIAGPQVAAIMKTMGKGADQLIPGLKSGAFNKADPFALDDDQVKNLSKFKSNLSIYTKVAGNAWKNFLADSADPKDGLLSGLFAKGADFLRKKFGVDETSKAPAGAQGPNMTEILEMSAEQERLDKERAKLEADMDKLRFPRKSGGGSTEQNPGATNLVRLGNFAFTNGGANPLDNTLRVSLDVQKKIEANTRKNRSVSGGDNSVPV